MPKARAAAGTSTPAVFRVEADAELVGHVAWTAGVALTAARPMESRRPESAGSSSGARGGRTTPSSAAAFVAASSR